MNALFDIWYGMSRRGRVFYWCAGVLCLTLTVALSVGYPGWKTLDTQQTRLSQQREAARQQWRHLRRLSVAAEPLFGRTVENPRPFSPLDFQAPPLRLLHWQPSAQGGEMALKTSWDAVPLFLFADVDRNARSLPPAGRSLPDSGTLAVAVSGRGA